MPDINRVKRSIKSELDFFDDFFKAEIKSQTFLLDLISKYVLRTKGKQMRPMLVFLAAKLNGTIGQSTYSGAFLIELMHTATLVHDDVVDDSLHRRSFFSINALWKNKVAVLVGDYFLAKGLLHAVKYKEYALLEIVSDAVKQMSEGELLQIEKARFLDITEDIYFEIIKKKTATLISAAMKVGARSVCEAEEKINVMGEIGDLIGQAFQIKDDIFDYEHSSIVGKPAGNDIKEQKITLPLIFVLKNASKSEKKWILSIIRNHNTNSSKVKELVEFVKKNGGVDYAITQMNNLRDKALQLLGIYPDSEEKQAMIALISYVTERDK